MSHIKLARLPDRTPIKLAITVMPDLNAALTDYAAFYERTYGERVAVIDLIPAMLESYLAGDKAFARNRLRPEEVRP